MAIDTMLMRHGNFHIELKSCENGWLIEDWSWNPSKTIVFLNIQDAVDYIIERAQPVLKK